MTPWGWRVVEGKKRRRAHYFERVAPPASHAYASNSSICGKVCIGFALEHWTAHPHAGAVPLCEACKTRLESPT